MSVQKINFKLSFGRPRFLLDPGVESAEAPKSSLDWGKYCNSSSTDIHSNSNEWKKQITESQAVLAEIRFEVTVPAGNSTGI